ncbi:hypothetical protein QUB33_24040 [Microcoleus sp. B3-A4]|uniref:hypothetical protein n=1 Tax=Microcoleus sp. B3-A4 TaxID=2818653 RepID=UPI002FD61E7C
MEGKRGAIALWEDKGDRAWGSGFKGVLVIGDVILGFQVYLCISEYITIALN